MTIRNVIALLVLFCACFNKTTAQVVKQPARNLTTTTDSIYYEIPSRNAKGFLSFNEWETNGKINLYFDPNIPSKIILIGSEEEVDISSPTLRVKTITPVNIKFRDVTKVFNVTFVPPFQPTFSHRYQNKKSGAVIVENTPVYELVNIVFALTKKGQVDGMTFSRTSEYYKQVCKYFAPYQNHALVALINKNYEPGSSTYRMIRESAYNYSYHGDSIVVSGPYSNFEEGQSILDDLHLWQDFAKESDFQKFYNDHKAVYESEITMAKKYLPLKRMWQWCEKNFSNRYNTYRIIVSPLVNGFHSTQNIQSAAFKECIMFVCGAKEVGESKPEQEKEGLYSGVVFTEIDHNYINPISEKYKEELNRIFSNGLWVKKGSQAEGYGNGTAYFNEYMTHAVFLLYCKDYYEEAVLHAIMKERFELMEWRGFPKFKEFYHQLSKLYEDRNVNDKIPDLYPTLIKWAKMVMN